MPAAPSSPGKPLVTTTDSVSTTSPSRTRVVVGGGVGNALEWYDWSAYAAFAPLLAQQFFNPADATSAMLATLAVFAVGFVMRPVGGLFFGWPADRSGRQRSMVPAMSLTALGSLVIAVAPKEEARLIAALADGEPARTRITSFLQARTAGRE
ncbi:MFS transporter [Streptomyces sp. SID12501]|uniref:MFS transporter n=1 Tax=Streptomyces sp. SID12501 TaxID=2706042 RepID=A0A6B3BLH9_9ACTN|nr:MFS transporter [Streptomyces sp. SID12501]NEC85082.1 MFS transporter [Streptomyces sp. SID12501]